MSLFRTEAVFFLNRGHIFESPCQCGTHQLTIAVCGQAAAEGVLRRALKCVRQEATQLEALRLAQLSECSEALVRQRRLDALRKKVNSRGDSVRTTC